VRRWIGLAGTVVVLVLFAIVVSSQIVTTPIAEGLVLTDVVGQVTLLGASRDRGPAREGVPLNAADRIITGPDGRAVLVLGPDTSIRLQQGSSLEVVAISRDEVHLELDEGRVEATVRPTTGALRVGHGGREVLGTDADFRLAVVGDLVAVEAERGELALKGMPGQSRLGEGQRLRQPTADAEPHVAPIPDGLLLEVAWPEPPRTRQKAATIVGQTEPGTTVILISGDHSVPVVAGPDGRFEGRIPLGAGQNIVRVEATDVFGEAAPPRRTEIFSDQGVTFGGATISNGGGP